MTDRVDFRALPVDPADENSVDNERRFRAAVEAAFFDVANNLSTLAKNVGSGGEDGDGCCGNIDGGHADSNYGGIFCPIDGGNASGTADTTP